MKKLYLILFLTFNLFANENREIILQLNWKNQFQFAGYYMAKELGYYEQAGLDVKIQEYEYGINTTNLVLENKAQFAVGRSSLIIDKSENKDIVALAAMYQQSPLMLLVRKDSGINTIADFKGKKIMMTTDAKTSASIMAMLQSNGIQENEFTRQEHSFNLQDLIDKKTDAMASYVSNEPIRLAHKKIPYTIFHPKDYGFNFYSDILFTSTKFLNENEKLVKDFYATTIKGWEYAFKNITQTSKIIYQKYNTQGKSQLDFILEGEELKKLIHHEGTHEIGCLDKKVVSEIVNTYKVLGLLENEIDLDQFIYKGNHHKTINFELEYNELFLISIIVILIFSFIVFILFFLSIKSKLLHTNQELENEVKLQTKKINEQHQIIVTQSRVAAVGEMIGHIAHQWRQPLNSITLQTSNIQASIALQEKIKDEILNETMESINDKCQYLSNTIDDFRNFFQNNKTDTRYIKLQTILDKAVQLTSDSMKSNQIELITNYNNNDEINANESAIMQILLNLINNSKDALVINNIPQEDRFIFIEIIKEDKNYSIIVKDSGGGIQEDIFNKIFEPYSTTKHEYQGTGLGLYMTYQIVKQQLKGDITFKNISYEYDNRRLSGAEFIIQLPYSTN